MKRDISANLDQKCLILCSKILLNMQNNLSLTDLLPWQHTGFETSPILKAFLATFGNLQMVPHIHVSLSLWPCLTFFELKITYILNSSGNLERVSCYGNKMFYRNRRVFCRTISLSSFNRLHCKLAKIALFIYLM